MSKTFRRSVGFYCFDYRSREYIVWHNCVYRPRRIAEREFNRSAVEPCPFCGQPVQEWRGMYSDCGVETDLAYMGFNYKSFVKVSADETAINIDICLTPCSLRGNTVAVANMTACTKVIIDVENRFAYIPPRMVIKGESSFSRMMWRPDFNRNTLFSESTPVNLPPKALAYISTVLCKMMKKIHGGALTDFSSRYTETTLDNLIQYLKCSHIISPRLQYRLDWLCSQGWHFGAGPFPKGLRVEHGCHDPIAHILKQSVIPDVKSLKKIAYENPEGIPLMALISCSFRNVDIIRSLYSAYINNYLSHTDYYIDFSARLIKTMIKHKGERIIAKKLISFITDDEDNDALNTLNDMFLFYDLTTVCDFDFNGSFDMEQLHAHLASSLTKKKTADRAIDYSDEELSLEMADEEFSVSAVKSTFELIDIGIKMNICVGGYADVAVGKRCSIFVIRRQSDMKSIGCVQLCRNRVLQVKGACNKLLKGKELEFIKRWIAVKHLFVFTNDLRGDDERKHRDLIA